jgi:hypothetical protein
MPVEGNPGGLTWFDRTGRARGEFRRPLNAEYLNPAIAPDGRVAVNSMDPQTGNWDVWIIDVARDIPSRLTFGASQDTDPVWSPDGKARRVCLASWRSGRLVQNRC